MSVKYEDGQFLSS